MPSSAEHNHQFRTYHRRTSVVFRKTTEEFGGLSNMAAGFPLEVNGLAIRTAEALYQACRFPHRPELQTLIIDQRSPMTAKMVGKPHRHDSRPDWDRVRVGIMRWTLRVKLAQNWSAFGDLLLATGDRPIVEDSRRDDFWGAKRVDSQTLAGMNVLGRLLMELREELRERGRALLTVEPPAIGDFLLDGRPIEAIGGSAAPAQPVNEGQPVEEARQPSLFDDQPSAQPVEPQRMITHLAPYPAYRDSGVPWLDEVPEHWELRRLKTLLAERSEKGHADEPLLAATQTKGVVRKEEYENRTVLAQKDLHLLKLVQPDDFVISLRSFQGGIEYARERGIISPAYTVLYPRDRRNHRYLAMLFKSKPFIENLTLFVTGIRQGQNIDYDRLSRSPIPLPPPEEQAAIVRFLDYADRRIRRYVRAKQRLIALLEEQKQAITHRAVTRGLDPDVRLKPSGVEWLGDIPEHWEVRRVKALLREVDRRSIHGREVLLSLRMKQGLLPHNDVSSVPISESSLVGFKKVEPGQLVMNRMRAAIGLFGVPGQPGLVSPDYAVFEPRSDLSLSFYLRLFKTPAMCGVFRTASKGLGTGSSGFMRLYTDQFGAIAIPFPPSSEQHAIAQRIDTELAEIDRTQERLEAEMGLLGEFRTRLIADVVTGKLDVREAAARLPEEMDEPEPLDDLDLPEDEFDDLDAGEVEEELAEALT